MVAKIKVSFVAGNHKAKGCSDKLGLTIYFFEYVTNSLGLKEASLALLTI